MVVRHWQNHQSGDTDPDCVPESAKSVSTSMTGSHARDRVVTLRENPSTISSLALFRGQKFHSSASIYEWILERTSDSS